ncbi:ribosome maturation factor RimM [Spirochaetia bacterium 38H-sp]|uniref:Ribosome maturation factor RimM n=1 Tax=Rarispira pelagica TaxID=3141764 RepID=A0ABU9UCJ3_9SPIR
MNNFLAIGYVKSAHGVRGNIRVCSFSGESEHFYGLTELTLRRGKREYIFKIEKVSGIHPVIIIKLEGLNTREDALRYKGYEVLVPREKAAPCRENEYYIADLIGCKIYLEGDTNSIIGTVSSVIETSNTNLMEVVRLSGDKVIIPFQDHFIGNINIENKLIELKAPWILE